MRRNHCCLASAAVLASGAAAHAQLGDMLIFSAGDDRFRHEATTADNLGRPYTHITGDLPALNAALGAGTYELAVIHNPSSIFQAETIDALAGFIDDLRRVHISYWNLDAEPVLQGLLGVATATDFFTPRPVFNSIDHPSWGDTHSPVNPAAEPSPWNDNGYELTSAGEAPVSAFDSDTGPTASIAANDNRTMVNGFDYDSMDPPGIIALLEAQIDWVEDARPAPPLGTPTLLFEADNDRHLAAALDQANIRADYAIEDDFRRLKIRLRDYQLDPIFISNPCCLFDAEITDILATRIPLGFHVHMSYWAMDSDPVLQDLFGIAAAVDFTSPRPVFNSNDHISWSGVPSPIMPAAEPTPWPDNGDELVPAAGATVIGTFDSPTGPGAIVIANETSGGYSTIFNGFDYDSMDDTALRALLAKQAEWLSGGISDCFADFDRDGSLTIFDFLAFQNAFDAGCP